jgi:rhamnose transport system permease protein
MELRWASLGSRLVRWAPVLFPVSVLALMLMLNPTLRSPLFWASVGRHWSGIALLAAALTPIIVTGGIDLSVGSVVGLAAVVTGVLWRDLGLPIEAALCGAVAAGLAAGTVNGTLVLAGVNPLVITLATLAVFRGLALGLSGDREVSDFPASLGKWWDGTYLGVPNPFWIVLVGFVFFYVFLHHTWMGRMLYAIGDNVQAARFAGVPVRALTFTLYALSGLVAGLVGMMGVLEFQAAPVDAGEGFELQAIACVVLGGVRITGGAGHLAGTALGTLTLVALLDGMVRVPARWRTLCTGVLLVAIAIANEALARQRARQEAAQEA